MRFASKPQPLNILHIVTYGGETCPAHQEFARDTDTRRKNALCTYFQHESSSNNRGIEIYSGDGTLFGFFRALKNALDAHAYDVIHIHYSFLFFFLLLASVRCRRNLLHSTIYTVHTSYPNLKLRNRFFTAIAFSFAQRVVFCSQASRDSFPKYFLLLVGKRQRVIVNGVNLRRSDATPTPEATNASQFKVISVGRLIKVKNPYTLLEAFNHIASQKDLLTFVGDGELRQELESLAEVGGVHGNVKFTGVIPRDDVYTYLKTSDLFVSSSFVEGMPIAVLEAMACRCPVILSDIPPHREISQYADFIPLVPADSPERLGQEIERCRLMSSAERKRIGDMCRNVVEEHFSLSKMLDDYHKVYCEIIS